MDFKTIWIALAIIAVVCFFVINELRKNSRLETNHFRKLSISGSFAYAAMALAVYLIEPVWFLYETQLVMITIAFVCFCVLTGDELAKRIYLNSRELTINILWGQWAVVVVLIATPTVLNSIAKYTN